MFQFILRSYVIPANPILKRLSLSIINHFLTRISFSQQLPTMAPHLRVLIQLLQNHYSKYLFILKETKNKSLIEKRSIAKSFIGNKIIKRLQLKKYPVTETIGLSATAQTTKIERISIIDFHHQ